jgi:hypothetical protein
MHVGHNSHTRGKTLLERLVANGEVELPRALLRGLLNEAFEEHFARRQLGKGWFERRLVPAELSFVVCPQVGRNHAPVKP